MKLYIDCDGVLTDGRLTLDECGMKQFKRFHTRDVTAIRELIDRRWEVIIVSADDWPGTGHFANKVGATFRYLRDKGNLLQPYYAVGDSTLDLEMLQRAERAFCPFDADPRVLAIHRIGILRTPGGAGVVAELAAKLLADEAATKRREPCPVT